jgi:peptidoglycan/xylan/chitin deacetylase (PgdA/CDA1 family)
MRAAVASTLLLASLVLGVLWVALAQTRAPAPAFAPVPAAAPATAATPAPTAAPAVAATPPAAQPSAPACPGNPNALGLARTVEIDTSGGPGFGFEHFKMHDFLRINEVVLTFDDGPWPDNTPAVVKALAEHCIKATFFPIGKHATYYPEILKKVAEAGHSIGSHTWGHKNLAVKPYTDLEKAKEEIEKGISAVRFALGAPGAPFFRFPALKHPPELVSYLGHRNIGIFSTDMDSFDFTMRRPEQVIKSVLAKVQKHGKGIVLMHDFQHSTAEALPELLNQLKTAGYKIVHMKAKEPVKTIAQYDELLAREVKLPTVSDRPTASVVRAISD